MEQHADSFLLASGKLQALCYKADIEGALRTKDFGGFQLLDLHDFPGQGTALVGVLDAFWGEKGYISPAEYKRFCNSTVPLARLKKCIFTNNETFGAAVEVAHYGDGAIRGCTPEWKITDKTGSLVAIKDVNDTDDLMIINKSGITIRLRMSDLRTIGRATQGVRLIKISGNDEISSVAKVAADDKEEIGEEGGFVLADESLDLASGAEGIMPIPATDAGTTMDEDSADIESDGLA